MLLSLLLLVLWTRPASLEAAPVLNRVDSAGRQKRLTDCWPLFLLLLAAAEEGVR